MKKIDRVIQVKWKAWRPLFAFALPFKETNWNTQEKKNPVSLTGYGVYI